MPTVLEAVKEFSRLDCVVGLVSDDWETINQLLVDSFVDRRLEDYFANILDETVTRFSLSGFDVNSVGTSLYVDQENSLILFLYPLIADYDLHRITRERMGRSPIWFESLQLVRDEDDLVVEVFFRGALH